MGDADTLRSAARAGTLMIHRRAGVPQPKLFFNHEGHEEHEGAFMNGVILRRGIGGLVNHLKEWVTQRSLR